MIICKTDGKKTHFYSRQQKVIFNVCLTCLPENLDGYNQFLIAYPYIVEASEVIFHKLHLEKYPNWRQWDTESRTSASVLLAGIATFEFCHCLDSNCQIVVLLVSHPTKKI